MRFFIDTTFSGIVSVLLLHIMFGIIIDTFAALRDQKNELYEDMRSKCIMYLFMKVIFVELDNMILTRTPMVSKFTLIETISFGITYIMCIIYRIRIKVI